MRETTSPKEAPIQLLSEIFPKQKSVDEMLYLNLPLLLLGATALTQSPEPFDWPQWQGSDRNAVSKETGLLQEWLKEGPPLAWKIKGLGGGDSTSVDRGRAHLRHEQSQRRRSRLGSLREGRQ